LGGKGAAMWVKIECCFDGTLLSKNCG